MENDRRALNVTNGMRRAIKEGRLMGIAPYGYINKCTEDGRKYVAVQEPEATNIIWAFKQVAKGHLPTSKVREEMNKREGRDISRNAFMVALRNVAYFGCVMVKAHGNEEEKIIQGKHDALISEELFMKVQYILKKKGTKDLRLPSGKVINEDRYPLRGLLICPKCGNNLTASSSKGRTKHYYYYHCSSTCGFRHHSEQVNELFQNELLKFECHPGIKDILYKILLSNIKSVSSGFDEEKSALSTKINALNERIAKARDMFLSDKLDEEDFRDIKKRYKGDLEDFEYKLNVLKASNKKDDIDNKIHKALNAITNISERYRYASTIDKRAIIGSIFPAKIIFNGTNFQTTKINSFAERIFLIKKEIGGQKKRHQNFLNLDARLVTKTSVSSNSFIDDLIRLSQIKQELAIPNLKFTFS